jgi:hypothetical protein
MRQLAGGPRWSSAAFAWCCIPRLTSAALAHDCGLCFWLPEQLKRRPCVCSHLPCTSLCVHRADMRFNFRDKSPPYSYASSLAHAMQVGSWPEAARVSEP